MFSAQLQGLPLERYIAILELAWFIETTPIPSTPVAHTRGYSPSSAVPPCSRDSSLSSSRPTPPILETEWETKTAITHPPPQTFSRTARHHSRRPGDSVVSPPERGSSQPRRLTLAPAESTREPTAHPASAAFEFGPRREQRFFAPKSAEHSSDRDLIRDEECVPRNESHIGRDQTRCVTRNGSLRGQITGTIFHSSF
jgi:hypothetical protein